MSASAAPAPLRTWPTLRKLLARFRPHPARTAFACGLVLLRTALELSVPLVVQALLDDLAAFAGIARREDHLPLFVLLGVMLFARVVIAYGAAVSGAALAQDIENEFRSDLFARVTALRFRWHDSNRSGKTIARSLRDMEKARHFFREIAFGYLELLLLWGLTIAGCAYVHPVFGVLVACTSSLAVWLTLRAGSKIARMDLHADEAWDHVSNALQENVAGARVVRAFGREPEEVRKFDGRHGTFTERWHALARFHTGAMPWIGSLNPLPYGPILVLAAWGVSGGWLTVGAAAAAILYVRTLHQRLRNLNRLVILGQQAVASASRVFEVLENEDVLTPPAAPRALPAETAGGRGVSVRFEGVGFAYRAGTPVLRGVDLAVPAGGSLGVLGPTGAGKSTLVALLPRFYDPDEGRILLGDADLRELDPVALRRSVAIVAQEPFLFSATVAENIAYGNPGIPQSRIEECARLAAAHDFIAELPQGYGTRVGERGVSLSGGQRQRLTIARALATDPRVLVFDDATAAVDARTETVLFDGIRAAAAGRTTIVISQRVTSLRWCDRIAVLDRGRVIASGTHEELLRTCPLYAEIDEHQRLQRSGAADFRTGEVSP